MEVHIGSYVYTKTLYSWRVRHSSDVREDHFCTLNSTESVLLQAVAERNAEIAKLRAERDEAREESAARLQRFCVPHWGDKNEGRCPICERDHIASEWSRDRNAFIAEKDDLHSHLAAAQKKRDDARAVAIQSDETAFRFRVKAARLEEQNIILTSDLAAARAALDKEREAKGTT